jgi:hypothetical protein
LLVNHCAKNSITEWQAADAPENLAEHKSFNFIVSENINTLHGESGAAVNYVSRHGLKHPWWS